MNPRMLASAALMAFFLSSIAAAQQSPGKVFIRSFLDLNVNGIWDDGEEGLQGSRYVIKGGTYTTSLVTDGAGSAWTRVPEGGSYLVLEEVPEGWHPTTPNPQTIAVDAGSEVYVRFGRTDQAAVPGTVEQATSISTSTSVTPTTTRPLEVSPPAIAGDAVRVQPAKEPASFGNIPPLMAIASFFAYVFIKRF